MVVEGNPILARRFRGGALESIHRGCWAVVDADGTVLAGAGDPDQPVFARSSSKGVQALASLSIDVVDRFGLSLEHVAVMISSHNGEPEHLRVVASLLDAIGLDEGALRCGQAAPMAHPAAAQRRIVHNCSGKHAGFLSGVVALGHDPATYLEPDSDFQVQVQRAVRAVMGVADGEYELAVDGCSAPTYMLSLRALGRGIARLTTPEALPPDAAHYARHCATVVEAAASHPSLVAGLSPRRFDTDLMRVTGGRLFSKGGADGVRVVGVPGAGLAFAAKCDDGSFRSLEPLALEVLAELGHLGGDELDALSEFGDQTIRNADGLEVGAQILADLPL